MDIQTVYILFGSYFLGGIFFLFFSILIWKYKKLNLINGYNPDKYKNKEGLSRWFGVVLAILSIIYFITAFSFLILKSYNIIWANSVASLPLVILLGVGLKKYSSND